MIRKKTKRQLQGEQTKENVFKAAVAEIDEKGYDFVTVDDICAKAGVSKGTFYVHYKSKEDIVRISHQQRLNQFMADSIETFNQEKPDASPEDRLQNFLLKYLEFARNLGPEMTALSIRLDMMAEESSLTELMNEREFFSELVEIIRDGQEKNAFTKELSIEQLANYIDSFIVGSYMVWSVSSSAYDIVENGKLMLPLFMKGLK